MLLGVSELRKPGRRRKLGAFRKKGLNSDAKVIVALLRKQPQTMEELCKSADISRATFYRVSQALDDFKIIKKMGERYALWNFCELEETVANAVEYLRLDLCRHPEAEEVAARIGRDPESVRKLLFFHAPELKWKPPTPEEKEEANRLRQKSLELAAQIKYSLDSEIEMSEVSMDYIKRVAFLLKHQFKSITLDHLPFRGVLLGPGLPAPPPPRERTEKEIKEVIQKLRRSTESK
jgi:hypothetical protein